MNKIEKQDAIYVAGLFDGEGCITIRLNRPTATSKHKSALYSLVVKVTMCHELTIRYLHNIFGVGHFRLNSGKNMGKKQSNAWSWTCMSKEAAAVLKVIYPYLITKKNEAKLAFAFNELPSGRRGRKLTKPSLTENRRKLYEQLRLLKPGNQWKKL